MDPLTRKLVQTVLQITENKNTGVPVLGNVNPVTGQREPGLHEYDPRTGEKTKSHSEGSDDDDTYTDTDDSQYNPDLDTQDDATTGPQTTTTKVSQRTGNWEGFIKPEQSAEQAGKAVALNQKLAARFPEAYPDQNLRKFTTASGEPGVLDVAWEDTTTTDWSPEDMATRMADWAKAGGDMEEFNKKNPGNPWETSTTQTTLTGFPLKEQKTSTGSLYPFEDSDFIAGLNYLEDLTTGRKSFSDLWNGQRGKAKPNDSGQTSIPMSSQIRPYTKPKEPHLQAQAQADYLNYMLGKYDPMFGARVGGEFSKLEDDLIKANQEELQAHRDQQTALAAATFPLPWLKGLGIASRVALGIGAPAVATSMTPPPFSTTAQEREEELEKAEEARQAKARLEKARKQTADLLKAVEGRTD